MSDLKVDVGAVASFVAAVESQAALVGAECVSTGRALGSGIVQDAVGTVSLVLTVLDQALAAGASDLALDARSSENTWARADSSIAMRPA
ncbi:alpha-mannosidase [Cellulomonas sp. Sa3CUA2]|uniref:Alpha-mannosidase n=1 Tax=Cellulomonas avistercoris TaxID=2762242 RepID=A0ABR8Q9C7_9CELL|nr:alpha-mannosidase [Cellulomonas avistercoris]MBD7917029.1 alpha-mannosidase [Cellulomonas avistercoris]